VARPNTIHLFEFRGIEVSLHLSWLVVAAIEIGTRADAYPSWTLNVLEYLGLFLSVLLHEFGHSLACRQVGGRASEIVLWPLGGVALVDPPRRPLAVFWSVIAGPLVNVVLAPLFWFLGDMLDGAGAAGPGELCFMLARINVGLLVFNLLPIYPLDGGKALQAVLWPLVGQWRALSTVGFLGLLGAGLFLAVALLARSFWIGILALFVGSQAWSGFRIGRGMARLGALPRRPEARCPHCGGGMPVGRLWRCQHEHLFDAGESGGSCPECGDVLTGWRCLDCEVPVRREDWLRGRGQHSDHP
jgi:Zn-dependent protease